MLSRIGDFIFQVREIMFNEIRMLEGQSRYDVFRQWQHALQHGFNALELRAPVVETALDTSYAGPSDFLTMGFNLVRKWTAANSTLPHFAWLVDHPVYHAMFFMPGASGMPANHDACLLGSVDYTWVRFAREVYGFPHIHFLPHGGSLNLARVPNWERRPLDVVFFGSCEDFETLTAELRTSAKALYPALQPLEQDFHYGLQQSLDEQVWRTARGLFANTEQALFFLNAFFPLLDRLHRCRDRCATLQSISRHEVHVYGAGPWDQARLPDNFVVHPAVSYAEAIEIMGKAKVLLNHTPTLNGGAHERIFDALLSGCYVLTTPSDYLKHEMPFLPAVRFFRPEKRALLDNTIEALLNDPGNRDRIRMSQALVMKKHHMFQRARVIVELIKERWKQRNSFV